MKLSEDIKQRLEKSAFLGLAGADVTKGALDATKTVGAGAIELGKWELKALLGLMAATSVVGGTAAGAAASAMTEPSADDMKKIENDMANIQIDRATAQLDRQMMTEEQLRAAARKKARQAKTLRLD